MLKFHVVSPSSTKTKYTYRIQ